MRVLMVDFGGFIVPIHPKWAAGDPPKEISTKKLDSRPDLCGKTFRLVFDPQGSITLKPSQVTPKIEILGSNISKWVQNYHIITVTQNVFLGLKPH